MKLEREMFNQWYGREINIDSLENLFFLLTVKGL